MNAPLSVHDIKQYGAKGDGVAIDSPAVQKAIDVCTASGGGTVYCPPGRYNLGAIEIKSGVTLHIEAGATLIASTDRQLYPPVQLEGSVVNTLNYASEHFIWAKNADTIAIVGRGVIDGNGRKFFGDFDSFNNVFKIKTWRPMQMIAFFECKNVLLEDITIVDSPGWTVWPFSCENIVIRGITIRNNRVGPNTDGIDPDCCHSVRISDCLIDAGDDCIALKSGNEKNNTKKLCENIVVTNCTLRTSKCAIRVGYEGDGVIRNCSFSNLVMFDTRTGINMLIAYHPEIGIHHGPQIENISFSNITMDVVCPFFLNTAEKSARPGALRNISFSNISGTAKRASFFSGSKTLPLENIRLTNIDLTLTGEMDDAMSGETPYPFNIWDYYLKKGLPDAFSFRYVKDLFMNGVRIRWSDVRGPWRNAIRMQSVDGAFLTGMSLSGAPLSRASAFDISDVKNALITNNRSENAETPFARVNGKDTSDTDIKV